MEEKILDLAIHVLYLKAWVTYFMSNSLNRLQHGARSAGLEAFLRQCGGRPDQFFALGESNRLPVKESTVAMRAWRHGAAATPF